MCFPSTVMDDHLIEVIGIIHMRDETYSQNQFLENIHPIFTSPKVSQNIESLGHNIYLEKVTILDSSRWFEGAVKKVMLHLVNQPTAYDQSCRNLLIVLRKVAELKLKVRNCMCCHEKGKMSN